MLRDGRFISLFIFEFRMTQAAKPFVITIVGPESSGKTTLASQLSETLQCLWVPEYARNYLTNLGRSYQIDDLTTIAEGQLALISSMRMEHIKANSSEGVKVEAEAILRQFGHLNERSHFLPFQIAEFGGGPREVVVIDNGLLSIKMWAKIKYGVSLPFVEHALEEDITDMYILCRPLPIWEHDPLRESPSLLDRAWIYNQFLQDLFKRKKKSTSMLL